MDKENLKLKSKEAQLRVLSQVLTASERDGAIESLPDDPDALEETNANESSAAKRRTANIRSLSGGDSMLYMESSNLGQPVRHPLFKKRYNELLQLARSKEEAMKKQKIVSKHNN